MKYLFLLFLLSCAKPCFPTRDMPNYTNYDFQETYLTPFYEIAVDDPKLELTPIKIDQTIMSVNGCLDEFRFNPLSNDEKVVAECRGELKFTVRPCLKIKVATDWHVSSCTSEQVFPCSVPFESCAVKGFTPNVDCPCSCRAIIQDNEVIVVTPNMKLLPAQLVTLTTGCQNPWLNTRLANCANPNKVP